MDRIREDGFRVRKAESRPPPNILFVPYNRAIIHSAGDRDGSDYPTPVLTVRWLAHTLAWGTESLQDRRPVQVQEGSVAQNLLLRLRGRWAIIRGTHPLTQRDQAHMGTRPRWFRIQSHNCSSCVTWAGASWFGSNAETGEDKRDQPAWRITHCSINATRWSKSDRRQFSNVLILFTVYSIQKQGLWLCTWCWYIFMFAFFVCLRVFGWWLCCFWFFCF